ncbi:PAS domain S-box protein [Siphonobacter sp. SORGH_AS_0500]|uniref:PAS domain-containing sensor histidine kinase n=1 Tax=Siphonobacter sp. SORGH_AS_0500 TaxID=1864824 RepID=UPI00285E6A67|nr:PAS domain S-box protein [Siphonobacter sp. SORGH_AS_0500]MDR6197773.1 PAS domain S-box-containing protein [Siphonobacter sp. SORGH_AS_0500]
MESFYYNTYPFFLNKGKMGQFLASQDWSNSALGNPDGWPVSLKITLGTVLGASTKMALFWGQDFLFFPNDAYAAILDNPIHSDQKAARIGHEPWALIQPLLERVWNAEAVEPFVYQSVDPFENQRYLLNFSPVTDENGVITGILSTATAFVQPSDQNQESETYDRQVTDTVPAIIWTTKPDGSCSYLNKQWYEYTGQTKAQAEGFGWLDATHPEDKDTSSKQFLEANEQHIPFHLLYRLRQHDGTYRWAIDKGSPRFDAEGNYLGMIGTVIDIHEQKLAEESLRASEAKLRSIVSTAPVAIGLFVGRDLIVENPNQTFIDIVGKGPDIVGKPLREVMPELIEQNQPFLQILDDVFTTGQRFHSYGSEVKIVQNGVMTHNIYNITYSPVFDEEGKVYAILDIAVDVTGEAKVKQALKESQHILQSMIDLAELGTYTVDLASQKLVKSPKVSSWYGLPEVTDVFASLDVIIESDRDRVFQIYKDALLPGSSGFYRMEYTIIHSQTSQRRILQTVGQVRRNLEGQPTHVDGLIRDVTSHYEAKAALEFLVQERTEELEATNEELTSSNENLAELNEQLIRSNESLEQFAYVASHDLQEPLRKIQQFSDLLSLRHRASLAEDNRLLDRIQESAQRMSNLINDLLTFSQLSTGKSNRERVNLSSVLNQVIDTLSVAIEESKASIEVMALPEIQGDQRQFEQLFQNLISNALKFSSKDILGNATVPSIRVSYQSLATNQLPFNPENRDKYARYHQVVIEDNGIGFEETYAERIFGVFQRLHSKNVFAGTGVGLAICQKVVTNHDGMIVAQGTPNQGAKFYIYLPEF